MKAVRFLDEEAQLSEVEEGVEVSSDEEDGEEQNQSLNGFVVDNTQFSQGLNDSEMHGVYLKSVRSPAVQGKFKISNRRHHNMDIFSQVPEMDETYEEDSFVVGSDVELVGTSEEDAEDVDLLPENSFVNGRKQYPTRRRVFLAEMKTKRTRVIQMNDSSEEEIDEVSKERALKAGEGVLPSLPKMVPPEPCGKEGKKAVSLSSKVSLLSKAVPATPLAPQKTTAENLIVSETSAPSGSVCILVDSRCISSGVELLTSLRQRHAATVHVCSLDSSYFIVSNRMAVERQSQSDLAAAQHRKRLAERVNSLQGLFERVCIIVEKDRTKTGEASRPFQRTRYFDSTLAALVRSGVRLLWSDGAEESAGLLADVARLEHRKGHGIGIPVEVKGQHRQQALQLYLSLPSVNYVQALNMSHNFTSIAQKKVKYFISLFSFGVLNDMFYFGKRYCTSC
uniref:ERCC4 domain-containing protein n=1 Tax=Neolamprologus brichardi TaxID=32507 RepID=A0A3Q4I9B0_NEOBR